MRTYETKKSKALRKKRQKRSNIIAMVLVIGVVLVLSVVIWNGKQALAAKNEDYIQKKTELTAQIAEQETRSKSLEEYKKYVQTKKYVEQIAKDKFGLIYPNDILFKPTN